MEEATRPPCSKCGRGGGGHSKNCATGKDYTVMSIGGFVFARDVVRETGEPQPISGSPGWFVRSTKTED